MQVLGHQATKDAKEACGAIGNPETTVRATSIRANAGSLDNLQVMTIWIDENRDG